MRIIEKFSPSYRNCGIISAVTLGTFDGVHIGHHEILKRLVRRARESRIEAVVITFDRHPSLVLNRNTFPGLLTTKEEKTGFFVSAGIDVTCVLEFTEQIAAMSAEEFIREYLVGCLGMKWFVVGYDHGFGRDRMVSPDDLRRYGTELGFSLEIVDPVIRDGTPVKSSVIRAMIHDGDMTGAAKLMGREYSFSGIVVQGTGMGRAIGIPTANIQPEVREKLIPGQGVYIGWVLLDGRKTPCVISIGPRPTFEISEETIEVHIPDFSGDVYGKHFYVGFIRKMRDIIRFESREALVEQIQRDIKTLHHHIVS